MNLPAEPRRVLVKQVNWLGDVAMSLPALRAVRRAYPHAHLAVSVREELAGFFAGSAWIDEVLPYRLRPGVAGMRDRVDIVGGWRRHSFDLAILFPDSFDAAMWAFAARIPERAGYVRDGRGFLLTRRARRTAATLTGHQVHYRLHLLEAALGIAGDPEDFVPDVDAGALAAIDAWLAKHRRAAGPLVALAPGAAYGPAKEWPAERWTALIDRLRAAHGVECVLIGSPGERRKCDEVAGASRGGAPIAAGETGIAEMIALLSRCAAFVGNDSGAMHVAGALGIPTVGIFGSTNPERTAPLGRHTHVVYRGIACSPCLQRTCRFGHYDCLRQIAVDEVTRLLAPYFEDRNA